MTDHYYTGSPNSQVRFFTISESLRRHLYIFKTLSGVFSFKKIDLGTKVLVENLIIPEGSESFLDLGCGYGVIGIIVAFESPNSKVYMTDINKRAIWCTKENVKINLPKREQKVKIIKGNYFEPFKGSDIKFDAIYTNPPLRRGRKEFLYLCEQIPQYLNKDGIFQFVIKRKMGAKAIYDSLPNDAIEILCKKSGYWVFLFSINRHKNRKIF
ncbi:MAG: class I SAM-dependent methyltransferase [Promethearchaeota archaeon]